MHISCLPLILLIVSKACLWSISANRLLSSTNYSKINYKPYRQTDSHQFLVEALWPTHTHTHTHTERFRLKQRTKGHKKKQVRRRSHAEIIWAIFSSWAQSTEIQSPLLQFTHTPKPTLFSDSSSPHFYLYIALLLSPPSILLFCLFPPLIWQPNCVCPRRG